MSLFRNRHPVTEERAADLSYTSNLLNSLGYNDLSTASVAGSATLAQALGHPAVWRSVNKIAGMYVQMPTKNYDGLDEADLAPVLADPSPGMFRILEQKRAEATSMLLRGNVYGIVSPPNSRGQVERCDLIHPDRVDWDAQRGIWTIDCKPAPPSFPLGSFWHVPFMTLPGSPKGLNPIEYARRTTYAGLAAQEFGGNFFRDGAHPTTVIQPDRDPGPDGAAALKTKVTDAVSGTDRDPLVLPASIKFHQLQINPDDSQFLSLMSFTGGQVAGFFGLRPEDIGLPVEGGSMDYSNRENRQQDILQDAVMPMVLPLDYAKRELVGGGQMVRSLPEGLLRSDLLTRYQSYETAARIEQATGQTLLDVNTEMRPLENRKPLTNNDRPSEVGE